MFAWEKEVSDDMRYVSWNVNGLRAVLKKGFEESVRTLDADAICLQEIKCQEGQVELELLGYHSFYSYAQRKGYSGTAVFTRECPLRVLHEIGMPELDAEGRIVACEFSTHWLVCVYTPNSKDELARLATRMEWDDAFRTFCKALEAGDVPSDVQTEIPQGQSVPANMPKPVIMCGDFNVAHEEIDLKNPQSNHKNAGFSDEERGKFTELLEAGFLDTFRLLYPEETGRYSWWSYRFNARKNNAGWRIDYFVVSESMRDAIIDSRIHSDIMGSDHCPVELEFQLA